MEKLHQHKTTLVISETNRESKHAEVALENARYNSPVDPTCIRLNTSVEQVRKSRQHRKKQHQLIRWVQQKKHRCSCLERLQNGPTEHRLNWRNQIQNTGAIVQRDPKTNYSLHRLIRRRWTSIRRNNEQNSTQAQLVKIHRLNRCTWNQCTGATKQKGQKTLTREKPTHRLIRRNISQASV